MTVITLDDDVTSKETPPEPVRTGSFNVIVGQSLGLADIGIDSNNLKGSFKEALEGQVKAVLPIKLRGLPTSVSGHELFADGSVGRDTITTSDPRLQFEFTLNDLLDKGFKPKINVTDAAGKVIVDRNGNAVVSKLFTGGIDKLRESGIRGLSAMVGGWEGAFDILINAMNGEVFGITLPIVGDKLKEEARFLEDMKSKVTAVCNWSATLRTWSRSKCSRSSTRRSVPMASTSSKMRTALVQMVCGRAMVSSPR